MTRVSLRIKHPLALRIARDGPTCTWHNAHDSGQVTIGVQQHTALGSFYLKAQARIDTYM